MYDIEITDEAYLDLQETYEYYESLKKGLGKRFIAGFDTSFHKIKLFPKHYQIKRNPYREVYISKFPYAIIFEVINQKIIIFAVFCTHKNPLTKPS